MGEGRAADETVAGQPDAEQEARLPFRFRMENRGAGQAELESEVADDVRALEARAGPGEFREALDVRQASH